MEEKSEPIKYERRVTQLTIVPKGKPIFSECATTITIEDEAGGEFLKITQEGESMRIDKKEWPAIRDAIDEMCEFCR